MYFFKIAKYLFLLMSALSIVPAVQGDDLKSIQQQAERGNPVAQFDLGTFYDQGIGVKKSYAEAARWYRKAAEQGEVAAQYNLAIMYDTGEGVERDIVQAYAWMGAAEIFGYSGAQESSKDFKKHMTPEQIKKGDQAIMEIVNRITSRTETTPGN